MMDIQELEGRGFVQIGQLDWEEYYSWSAFGVWIKDHQLFYAYDDGCSCNYPWMEGVDPQPATLDEIRKQVRDRSDWEGRDKAEAFIRDIEKAVKND